MNSRSGAHGRPCRVLVTASALVTAIHTSACGGDQRVGATRANEPGAPGGGGGRPASAGHDGGAGRGTDTDGGAGRGTDTDGGGGESSGARGDGAASTGGRSQLGQGGSGGSPAGDGAGGTPPVPPPLTPDVTLCAGPGAGEWALDVWSDPRGPFVLVSRGIEGYAIWHRGSAGWSQVMSDATTSGEYRFLTGIPGGPLWLYGSLPCGVVYIEDGQSTCGAGVADMTDVFVVSETLAYAVRGNRVLVYRGDGWVQFGVPIPPSSGGVSFTGWALWGDNDGVIVTSVDGRVAGLTSDGQVETTALPDGVVGWRVWRSQGVTFIGSREGQLLANDGTGWQVVATLNDACDPRVGGLWGTGRVLFLHTGNQLARWDGAHLEVLLSWPCHAPIGGIWGTDAGELFVAAPGLGPTEPGCGDVALYKYDGTTIWQM